MTKKIIVLDKSVVRGAPKGFLESLREEFDFLLAEILMHEIGTEDIEEQDKFTDHKKRALNRRILATFEKAINETEHIRISYEAALTWEITTGCSARHLLMLNKCRFKPLDKKSLLKRLSNGMEKLSRSSDDIKKILDYDSERAKLASLSVLPGEQKTYQQITNANMTEKEIYAHIQKECQSKESFWAEKAREAFIEKGRENGLSISPFFTPQRDWLSFGIVIAGFAFRLWKLWKYGDKPIKSGKSPNPYFDTLYVAYVAIADGILSADKDLLKLSWVCWPEKRNNIYKYDMGKVKAAQFKPKWAL